MSPPVLSPARWAPCAVLVLAGCSTLTPEVRVNWFVSDEPASSPPRSCPLTPAEKAAQPASSDPTRLIPAAFIYIEYLGDEAIDKPRIVLNARWQRWVMGTLLPGGNPQEGRGWALKCPPPRIEPRTVYVWPASDFVRKEQSSPDWRAFVPTKPDGRGCPILFSVDVIDELGKHDAYGWISLGLPNYQAVSQLGGLCGPLAADK